jgi:hypothetical protein
MADTNADVPQNQLTDSERDHLAAALVCLAKCQHPQVRALHEKVNLIANPDAETRALAKLDAAATDLQKADRTGQMTRTQAMERARRENPQLARELHDATRRVAV